MVSLHSSKWTHQGSPQHSFKFLCTPTVLNCTLRVILCLSTLFPNVRSIRAQSTLYVRTTWDQLSYRDTTTAKLSLLANLRHIHGLRHTGRVPLGWSSVGAFQEWIEMLGNRAVQLRKYTKSTNIFHLVIQRVKSLRVQSYFATHRAHQLQEASCVFSRIYIYLVLRGFPLVQLLLTQCSISG